MHQAEPRLRDPRPRSRRRHRAPPPALRGAARGDPRRAAPARRAPAVDADAGARPRRSREHGAHRVRAAPRRGLPDGARRRGTRVAARAARGAARGRGRGPLAGAPGAGAAAVAPRPRSLADARRPGPVRRRGRSGPGCRRSTLFPLRRSGLASSRAAGAQPRRRLDYGTGRGYPPLREAIAATSARRAACAASRSR